MLEFRTYIWKGHLGDLALWLAHIIEGPAVATVQANDDGGFVVGSGNNAWLQPIAQDDKTVTLRLTFRYENGRASALAQTILDWVDNRAEILSVNGKPFMSRV